LLHGAIDEMPTRTATSMAVVLLGAAAACGGHAGAVAPTGDDGGTPAAAGGGGYVTIPLSSCVPSSYTAAVTIGGSQAFQLVVDTGSTTLGVASSSCKDCSGVAPLYDPGSSAVDQHHQASSQFETGQWSGEIYEDTVATGPEAALPVRLVAIDSQSQFFVETLCDSPSGGYQGVLGLGPSAAAVSGTDGYLDRLVAAGQVPDVFALWLCDAGGTLWLGGWDAAAVTAAPSYTRQLAGLHHYYYAVALDAVDVAGTRVPVPSGRYTESVIDAGSTAFVLPTAAFDGITKAIAASPGFVSVLGSAGAAWFSDLSDCRTLSQTKAELDATLPPVGLVFDDAPDAVVRAPATESYLVQYQGQWCPALYALDPQGDLPFAAILGSPIMRSNVVVFDRANQRIGFAPHAACPGG
jgi:hypothetical protein